MIGTGNQGFNDISRFLATTGCRSWPSATSTARAPATGRAGRRPRAGPAAGRGALRRTQEVRQLQGCDAYVDFRELLGRKDIDAVLSARRTTGTRSRSSRLQGRQGHLLPEAAVADHRRRPGDELRGQESQGRLPDRQPAALRPSISAAPASWFATAASASCRRSAWAARRPARLRQDRRPQEAREGARGLRLRPLARPGAEGRMPRRAATSTSAGSTTTPAARSPTGAATIPTVPSGAWAPNSPARSRSATPRASFPPTSCGTRPPSIYFEAIYDNGVKLIVSNKERRGSPGREPRASLGQPRQLRRRTQVDPRLEDRPRRDSSVQERQPLPQLHRLRDLAEGDGRAGRGRPPIDHDLPPGQYRHAAGPRKTEVGPAKEQIIGDDEAAKMLSRPYRAPYPLAVV